MSNGTQTSPDNSQAYYQFVLQTSKLARKLTENCIMLQEAGLASSANLMYVQLQQMITSLIDDQVASIPQPSFVDN